MKKLILSLILLSASLCAHAGPWDYTLGQYDQFGVSPIPRLVVLPSGSASGIFIHNTSTNMPMLATVDTSLAISTSYQATDNTKAAIIYPSYACQNATQVLASSACTVQVSMGTGTLTCSTGTDYYTQSLGVSLGVLLTQNSTNPVPINLPIGGSFILCQVAGTFTISTVEQSAG